MAANSDTEEILRLDTLPMAVSGLCLEEKAYGDHFDDCLVLNVEDPSFFEEPERVVATCLVEPEYFEESG